MPNKLLINVSPIRMPLTGIGYYTLNILTELLTRNIDVMGIHNGKVISRDDLVILADNFSNTSAVALPTKSTKRFIIEFLRAVPGVYQLKNKLLAIRSKNELKKLAEAGYVYFEPSFVPFEYLGKTITTIHDLSFLSHPSFHPSTRVAYLTDKMKSTISNSDHIVVDSNFILSELHQYYPLSLGKSSTLYLGVAESFQYYPESECNALLKTLNLRYSGFLLSVATLEPRKNLSKLIEAYKQLPSDIRSRYPLVLVGDQGWKNAELLQSARELVERNQIVFTGYVSDDDLKRLYASAGIFVYPSLYEGFGLPVIEAMASGIPVITSNVGATAEVARSGALLVDPLNDRAISDAILDLIQHPENKTELVENGMKRAKMFNWSATVDQLLKIALATSRNA